MHHKVTNVKDAEVMKDKSSASAPESADKAEYLDSVAA